MRVASPRVHFVDHGPWRQSRGLPGHDALTGRSSPAAPTEPALPRLAPASQNSLRHRLRSDNCDEHDGQGARRGIAGALSSCAPQPVRPRLCRDVAGTSAFERHLAGYRGSRCTAGAISGAVVLLGPGVGPRSALRDLTRRGCPSGACPKHAQRVLRRDLRAKQCNVVRAQRGPSQHEPTSGVGCRGARSRQQGNTR
jgi:hypothetical protein